MEDSERADSVETDQNGRVSSPQSVDASAGADLAASAFALTAELGATVRITDVQLLDPDSADIRGFHLTRPVPDGASQASVIWFDGWVVGSEAQATAVEVMADGKKLRRVPVAIPSPALTEGFPDVEWASTAAFRGAIGPVRLRSRFELTLVVELGGTRKVPFAKVAGERTPLPTADPQNLQPIMMTGLGRSGTTWVMQLLEQHPEIAVFQPFDYEPRVAAYWTEVMVALTQPASFLQTLAATPTPHNVWWIGEGALVPRPPKAPHPQAENWLGASQLDALAAVSSERIEAFYAEVAKGQNKPSPRFFSETGQAGCAQDEHRGQGVDRPLAGRAERFAKGRLRRGAG